MTSASSAEYELLDFGDGRKLERFGDVALDRPCPAAEGVEKTQSKLWRTATARFDGRTGEGEWRPAEKTWKPNGWVFRHDNVASFQLELEALPSGQVGVFPEQAGNWDWIVRQVGRITNKTPSPQPSPKGRGSKGALRVLNLFAYTGGSTLAAVAAGAEVVHVDAASSVVDRARRNAAISGLAVRPIRWIVEDAMKFCRREAKRGNKYDAVILDPPTYGHGPKGEPWKLGEHLLPLLELCGELTAENRAFVLVTCHSPGIGPADLSAYLSEGIFGHCGQPPKSGELYLETADGRRLPSGVYARWPA
jgi:23S rRNA (cytosine1962-C5)-methyltransferase